MEMARHYSLVSGAEIVRQRSIGGVRDIEASLVGRGQNALNE